MRRQSKYGVNDLFDIAWEKNEKNITKENIVFLTVKP